jgi:hypothetical protein
MRSGRKGAQLNVTFCDLACSWLTRASPPFCADVGALWLAKPVTPNWWICAVR